MRASTVAIFFAFIACAFYYANATRAPSTTTTTKPVVEARRGFHSFKPATTTKRTTTTTTTTTTKKPKKTSPPRPTRATTSSTSTSTTLPTSTSTTSTSTTTTTLPTTTTTTIAPLICASTINLYDANSNYLKTFCWSKRNLTYAAADAYCTANGMSLFAITSADEYTALKNAAMSKFGLGNGAEFYINGRQDPDGSWWVKNPAKNSLYLPAAPTSIYSSYYSYLHLGNFGGPFTTFNDDGLRSLSFFCEFVLVMPTTSTTTTTTTTLAPTTTTTTLAPTTSTTTLAPTTTISTTTLAPTTTTLAACSVSWQPYTVGSPIPADAYQLSVDALGNPVYVGKGTFSGQTGPGNLKLLPTAGFFYPYSGLERLITTNVEYLSVVGGCTCTWISMPIATTTPGLIVIPNVGGINFYIGEYNLPGTNLWTVGKVGDSLNTMWYSTGGVELTSSTYTALACA